MHWALEAAMRAGLSEAGNIKVERGVHALDVWTRVVQTCGIAEDDLARHVAAYFELGVADLDTADAAVLRLLPEGVARQYMVFPMREDNRNLIIATGDPMNLDAEQAIEFVSGRRVVWEVAPPRAVDEAIQSHYSSDQAVEILLRSVGADAGDVVRIAPDAAAETVGARELDAEPVIKLTNAILRDAIASRASDIHLEPRRLGGRVRFRVDGALRQYMQMPLPALIQVISRLKVLGKLDLADRLRPQDGVARIRVNERVYDLRLSTVPTRGVEKAVVRILDPGMAANLEDIELPAYERSRLRHALSHRDGLVAVTGPTGSGKTTTMYAAIRELSTEEINIMTVEDPVEYDLSNITQIQVEPKQNVTFVSALRAILRQDPDAIFVGEIRDLETAQVAIQASMTGHLVLATLHANDAVGVVQRLLDLGLGRRAVADTLRASLAQRLVRRVCPDCVRRSSEQTTAEDGRLAAHYGIEPRAEPAGCPKCGHTGYRGRLPVVEVALVDRKFSDLIIREGTFQELESAALEGGMRPMRAVAVERVRAGETTPHEVERVFGETPGLPSARPSHRPHVLVVDDDAVTRTLVRNVLEQNRYRVSEAEDGDVVLERLAAGAVEYSLLLLDLDMPNVGGEEVLDRVRSSLSTVGLPVIVLTATEDPKAESRLIEKGANDYIRKPIDAAALVARIGAALRRADS